jgi:hypothetical protein
MKGALLVSLVAVGCASGAVSSRANLMPPAAGAELVLDGGRVLTDGGVAESIAIADGKIVAIGKSEEVRRLVASNTRVVRLEGRVVVASLTDSHGHLYGLGRSLEEAELRGCTSDADCASKAKSVEGTLGKGEWARGRGWDQNRFAAKTFPTHSALDKAFPDRPAWMTRVDGHAGWANAAAMKLAGITRETADPPGGRVVRDPSGQPTGVFVDAAMDLVEKAMPAPSLESRERAILKGQELVLAHGITGVHEMGIDAATVSAYGALAASGKLRVRVYAFGDGEHWLARDPDPAAPYAMFTLRGVKLFADGALGSRGAALTQPYSDDPGNAGLILASRESLEVSSRKAIAKGWQIAVHAIGDRANRNVLDAFAAAGVRPAHRFRIEHAQVVDPDDVQRFRDMGVIASMQPAHATSDMPWAEARLGKARVGWAYTWRRFLDAHVLLASGSDFPVEEVDLLGGGLLAAVARGGWTLEQKMTMNEALASFTVNGAYAAFQEGWRGRAAVGQAADLTVIDRELRPETLRDARVDMTIVAGRVVHER